MKQKLFRLMLLMLTVLVTVGTTDAAKKVHTLGDSTMAPYDESATNTRGWGMYFGNFLTNGWTSVNYAKGGRDSRGGYNELWQNAKNNVEAGDYVLIQFAHNDGKYNGVDNLELQAYYTAQGDATNAAAVKSDGRGTTPSTTYKACLKQIIDAVKEKGATPILVSAVCRCYFTNGAAPITRIGRHDLGAKYDAIVDGQLKTGLSISESDHTYDYSYQMEQLATEESVTFIDMTTATKNLYESYGSYDKCYAALFDKGSETDNTHYNLTGALTAARLCAQLIKDKGILTDAIEIPTDLSFNPTTADMGDVYVGQSATKELTLSGLGLEPATGTITITPSEGIQLSTDKQNWQNTLEINYESGTLIKTIYAKVAATVAGVFNGTVTAALGAKTAVANVTMNAIELGGGDPFTATWALTADDNAVVNGNATAAAAKVEGMVKYGNTATNGMLVSTSDGGAWVAAEDDSPNQYVQFTVTAPDGKKLDINHIAMKVGGHGGNGMRCHVYYSTDGFVTRTTIYSPGSMASGVMNEVDVAPVISLEEGDQLQIRVYPWYTSNATGKWLCISDVVVGGQSKDAAGVNIQGTITYALDKGGLSQGDDVVMDPNELSAGFAGKTWTAGSALTVSGTQSYQGASGEANITQTKVENKTDSSLATTAGADNTLTLTLTPEDGFSFVPTRLSFQAARYGTDSGNIGASVDAGDTHVDLVTNAGVNRSGKNLTIASFSEEISGVTATADKPLKVNFSFLTMKNGKSMGLSNVVIEGTLVGAAAQVTKYVLTTQVVPAEAGSIIREPELEQFKEGAQVTLKATKNFGYKFKEWQDATGAQVSTDAETTITMDAEKTMKAVFEAVPLYKVTTKVTNDTDRDLGSITLTPNDHNGQYEEGTKITATANESKILKFLSWTDENENSSATATRELTVGSDMTLVANYEVQDFIAVFDASKTASYAYDNTAGYPFAADEVWDANRNAKSCVVKMSDGSLLYSHSTGTPVVRNRQGVVISAINGLYQNGYHTADIAWQYQFSTKGFTSATFNADMCAKNAATKQYKALISVDGGEFSELKAAWDVTANAVNPLVMELPASAIGKETVIIRITGTGDELYTTNYPFDAEFNGMRYSDHSESGVGNVYILGEAEVTADEVAPKVTATVPADNATGVSATGKITISFDEKIEAGPVNGVATLNNQPLTPVWSNRSVSFDYSMLDYNTEYTFSMPAGFVQDKSGNQFAEAVSIKFTTMNRPTVAKAMYDFIVPDNGTIDEALAAANGRADKTTRFRVFIKNSNEPYVFHPTGKVTGGDGNEYDNPTSVLTAANTSFIGESIEGVVLTNVTPDATWDNGFGAACPLEGIGKGDVLQIKGSDSYFQNLTVKTSMGDAHGRDIAVNDQSNRTIFKDACLWGYQDTYVSNNQNGKFYFEGGIIRGRTDYVCGKGDVYYNKVTFQQVKSGYLAVPSVPKQYGYIFQSCKITGDTDDVNGTYTLGRPWGKGTPIALFIDTEMEVQPSTIGWSEMSNGWPMRMAEYGSHTSKGASVDLSGRKTTFGEGYENNPVLTAEEAAQHTLDVVMGQDDQWQPTLLTEQAPVPTNVQLNNNTLTWDGSDYALLWAVCKDGQVVGFTTEPTFNVTENGSYTVRAANEMGGLGAESDVAAIPYTVTLPEVKNGNSIVASPASATAGTEVTLTITTADAYQLTQIMANQGVTLNAVENEPTQRTFTMPAADVTISANWEAEANVDKTKQITEDVAVDESNNTAEINGVEVGENTTTIEISGTVGNNDTPVTSIAAGTFTAENTAKVQSIDLSQTSVNLDMERTADNSPVKDVPANTLIYLPAGSTMTGDNVIVKEASSENFTCKNFVMEGGDATGKSYSVPKPFTATSAKLNREFQKDVASTVCLPYALTQDQANALGAFYYFSSVEGTTVNMTQVTSGGLESNKPYMFLPNDATGSANAVTATNVSVSISGTQTSAETGSGAFTFQGVIADKTFTSDEITGGIYGFAAEADHGASSVGQFVRCTLGAYIKSFRAYLVCSTELTATNRSQAAGDLPEVLTVKLIHADGTTTTIGKLELIDADDDAVRYNLNGQRVGKSHKGIVIKNGKKGVVK